MKKSIRNKEVNLCPACMIISGCEVEEISVNINIDSEEVDNGSVESEWVVKSEWVFASEKFEALLDNGTKLYLDVYKYKELLEDLINEWIEDFDPEFYDNDDIFYDDND